jgi:hypothetical protein
MDEFLIGLLKKYKNYNEKFIYELIDHYIKVFDIEDYVLDKNSKLFILGNKNPAYYLDESKNIFVDRYRLYKYLKKESVEDSMHKKIIVSQLTLHEIFHGDQNRIMNTENTMEAQMLRLSKRFDELKYNSQYTSNPLAKKRKWIKEQESKDETFKKNNELITKLNDTYDLYGYYCAPAERLAQSKSIDYILTNLIAMEADQEIINNLYKMKKYCLYKDYYRLSEYNFSPFVKYCKELGYSDELLIFPWYDIDKYECLKRAEELYPVEYRAQYGLPIDPEEVKIEKEKIQQLIK